MGGFVRLGAGALTFAIVAAACAREPRVEERSIVVYSPRSCPVSQDSAFSVLYASGDFEPVQDRPPSASLYLRDVGTVLGDLPKTTRSLIVDISEPGRNVEWLGLTETMPSSGPIPVLVWPGAESCRLSRSVERRADSTLGVFGTHVLVAGGHVLDSPQVPHTFVGDLSSGIVERLASGLLTRRNRPSVTAFDVAGADNPAVALVAGGEDPDSGRPLDSAEMYVRNESDPSSLGDFDGQRIALSQPRAQHGAVVLGDGTTLLVGGVGPSGPLRTMEIVDPKTKRAHVDGVALLSIARERPTVLRLASGEVLVAGGFDGDGRAVPTIEWFSPDASRPTKRSVDLVTGKEHAFVPLEAGGVLAVVIPERSTPDFKTVWMLSADGSLEPGIPIDPATLDTVRLFRGAENQPVLWTGRRWMRWQPWSAAFETMAEAPAQGPSTDAIANGDSGLALWLEDQGDAGMYVMGFRFATRTQYASLPKPLLVDGPGQLAPDRVAGVPGSAIQFDRQRGLVLGAGASAFLTDVTFADFALDVDVTAGAPSIVLREPSGRELEVGGAACAFGQDAERHLSVVRTGREVFVRADDREPRTCPTELERDARVALGLRGAEGSGVSGARNLYVTRR